MELKDFAETMSLDGRSPAACGSAVSNDQQAREVYYFGLFPNLLISLHPDYVMTHRFEPLGRAETQGRVPVALPARGRTTSRTSRPAYASEFWDITNREDWLGVRVRARAGWHRAGSAKGRSPGARTRSTSSWRWWRRATWTASPAAAAGPRARHAREPPETLRVVSRLTCGQRAFLSVSGPDRTIRRVFRPCEPGARVG